jgi:hypothetical protein
MSCGPDLTNPNEAAFVGYFGKMLKRYGSGITEAEYDILSKKRRAEKTGARS